MKTTRIYTVVTAVLLAVGAAPCPEGPVLAAAEKTYAGNGIRFSYPDSYKLDIKTEKTVQRVSLIGKTDSVGISVIETEMSEDMENRIIEGYRKKYEKMSCADIRFSPRRRVGPGTKDAFPFTRINTQASRVDASFEYREIRFRTVLYLFSVEGAGYIIEMTCRSEGCTDFPFFRNSLTLDAAPGGPMRNFAQYGVSFSHPPSYTVTADKKQTMVRVTVQKKGSSLGVIVLDRPLTGEMEKLLIEEYRKKLGRSGFTDIWVSEKMKVGRGAAKPFPFKKVKTGAALAVYTFKRKGIHFETLLYIFNRAGKGCTIDITRMTGITDVFGFIYETLELR